MPAVTWKLELPLPYHPDVCETLLELREKTKRDWQIRETEHLTGWFGCKTVLRFMLYGDVGAGEYQIINFYSEPTESSIRHSVPSYEVVAYMMGIIAGVEMKGIKNGDIGDNHNE